MRITRSTAKKDNKDDDVKEEEEDDDGEVLRCDTSRADERFVSARLEDYEDMYWSVKFKTSRKLLTNQF